MACHGVALPSEATRSGTNRSEIAPDEIGEHHVMKDPGSERHIALVVVISALVLFALLWLLIDANTFSSVRGAP
jgi:hypothetical protein